MTGLASASAKASVRSHSVTARLRTAPRKRPTQARATATVEVILQATARLLGKDGYDHLSTNKVAAAAGVSVGSLYQYFPSKEALVAALAERHRERIMGLVLERIAAHVDSPPEVAIRAIVRGIIEAHGRDRALHRVLSEQIPRIGKLKTLIEDIEVHAAGAVRAWLERRPHGVRVKAPAVAAFVVSHAVEAIVHAGVLGDGALDAQVLEDEVVDLVLRYLVK